MIASDLKVIHLEDVASRHGRIDLRFTVCFAGIERDLKIVLGYQPSLETTREVGFPTGLFGRFPQQLFIFLCTDEQLGGPYCFSVSLTDWFG